MIKSNIKISRSHKRKKLRKIFPFLTALSASLILLLFLSSDSFQKETKIHSRNDSSRRMNRRDQPAGLFLFLRLGRAGDFRLRHRLLSALSALSAFSDCQGCKQYTPDSAQTQTGEPFISSIHPVRQKSCLPPFRNHGIFSLLYALFQGYIHCHTR